MAMANPWMQKSCWDEWKRQIEENKRRRLSWMQRVMRYAKTELVQKQEDVEDDIDSEDDDSLDGEEAVTGDNREEQNREVLENQEEMDVLKKYLRQNGESPAGISHDVDFECLDGNAMLNNGEGVDNDNRTHEKVNGNYKEVDTIERDHYAEENGNDDEDVEQRIENPSDLSEFDNLMQNSDGFGSLEDHVNNYGVLIQRQEDDIQILENNDNNLGDLAMGGEEEVEVREEIEEENVEEEENERDNWEDDEDDYDQSYEYCQQDFEQGILSDYSEFDYSSQNSASGGSEIGENTVKLFDDEEAKDLNPFEDLLDKNKNASTKTQTNLDNNEEPAAKKLTTKDYRDVPQSEEDLSTDDEEAEFIGDEDADCYDQNEIHLYSRDSHSTEVFHTLKEFRDALILTDLELKTIEGTCIYVHSVVLAAVSYFVWKFLNLEQKWDTKTQTVKLSKEVEDVGLEAVVEFAYTGAVSCLNSDNVDAIKKAARFLGTPRVMEVCEREFPKRGQKRKDPVPASEQLAINLETIEELWSKKKGCDVTLDVLSASFRVHKVILAACSDYFRAMFTLGMKESSQSSVYLQFLTAPELEALISCSYSGSVSLSWNCAFEITTTALQLQCQPALDLCLKFLQKEINPYSCLDLASFAEAFGMVQLLEFAEDYILRQFEKVARTAKFKDLPARNLLKYLNSFALCVPSELVVFRAVVNWIQAKPKKRLRLAKELMKTIHFPLMTFKEFSEVQALNIWSDHSLQELYDAIFEDFCSNQVEVQNQCRIYLPKESLVLSGGDQISEDFGNRSISKDLWFGNSLRNHMGIKKAMEWRKLSEMPLPGRFSHEVAVFQGQLYVVGGKKYYGTRDTLSSVFRYNPLQNSWEELASMHQSRCSFSLVVLDAKLYAIGGHSHPDYIESVERYSPTTNAWSFTCPLDLPLGGHVAREFQGQIFVCGGLNSDYECLTSMFAYDPEKGSTYLENMTQPRAYHCMEVLGDFLYVAGGLSHCENTGIVDLLTCEMYNPAADSWTCFLPLPVPHVGAGSAVLEGKFYVLGGYRQEDFSDTKMVHRYNPATQQWENMGKMPGPNNDIRACVLGLPEHLRLSPD